MLQTPIQRQLKRLYRLTNRTYKWFRGTVRSPQEIERDFRSKFFATESVNLDLLPEFRKEYFPNSGPIPWLDREDALSIIELKKSNGEISNDEAAKCRQWKESGFLILENAVESKTLDRMWNAYEEAIKCKMLMPEPNDEHGFPGRYLNPHLKVSELNELLQLPLFNRWLETLLGPKPIALQTITSHRGSEQKEHSDIIHMSTYPLGYFAAIWVAFEDIDPDAGPLVYYPGSHRLPYFFSQDVGIKRGEFKKKQYSVYTEKYEPFIQRVIEKHELKPTYFTPKKGDALIWHANLIHGGSQRINRSLSRKSVVCHYFSKGAICYHDLAGGKEMEAQSLYNN